MIILKLSVTAGIFILAITIIRAFTLRWLPKKTFIVLWSVALYRSLSPFSVATPFSIYALVDTQQYKSWQVSALLTLERVLSMDKVSNAMTEDVADVALAGWGIHFVMAIWLIGVSSCALIFLIIHFRHAGEYKTAIPVENELINRWKEQHSMRRKVEVRQSDKIRVALTYGLIRPVVVLPKTIDWTNETRVQCILAHEYAHIHELDILLKWLLTIAVCVHWFNPLMWIMYMLANHDMELSCDEMVVRSFGEASKLPYALTLIALEEEKISFAPFANGFSKNLIEERMVLIMQIKKNNLAKMVAVCALVIVSVTIFATDSVSLLDNNVKTTAQEVENIVGMSVNDSVDFIKTTEVIKMEEGAAATHAVKNGQLCIYKDGKNNKAFEQGERVTLEIDIENVLAEGQTTVIGYINDNSYMDVFKGRIIDHKSITFTIPKKGKYDFYLIGASSDAIQVRSFSIL